MNLFPAARNFFDSAFDPFAIAIPLVVALTMMYRWIPPNVKSWRSPFAAALLVAVLIEVARYLITHHFATLQQLKSLYGAFVAIPVLMVSAFVLWAIVLYGAALVAEGFGKNLHWPFGKKSKRAPRREPSVDVASTTKGKAVS